ncbi:MAG: hypothetical protein M0Z31_10235 [Clostridia bacterium]|nr:hypothetical protein [Clostridia bacterium]
MSKIKSVDKNGKYTILIVGISFLVILAFIIYFLLFSTAKDYRLINLEVREAMIAQMDNSDKPWIRVSVPGLENEKELWIEVSKNFYNGHYHGQQVGILLGQYNENDKKMEKGKRYMRLKRQIWGAEEIYNSLEEAKAANPVKKYTSFGKVVEKDQGVLVLDLDGKKARSVVEKELYDRIKVGDTVKGRFESIGEYTKFFGIEKG